MSGTNQKKWLVFWSFKLTSKQCSVGVSANFVKDLLPILYWDSSWLSKTFCNLFYFTVNLIYHSLILNYPISCMQEYWTNIYSQVSQVGKVAWNNYYNVPLNNKIHKTLWKKLNNVIYNQFSLAGARTR